MDRLRAMGAPLVSSEGLMKPASSTYSTSASISRAPAVLYNLHRPSAFYLQPEGKEMDSRLTSAA